MLKSGFGGRRAAIFVSRSLFDATDASEYAPSARVAAQSTKAPGTYESFCLNGHQLWASRGGHCGGIRCE